MRRILTVLASKMQKVFILLCAVWICVHSLPIIDNVELRIVKRDLSHNRTEYMVTPRLQKQWPSKRKEIDFWRSWLSRNKRTSEVFRRSNLHEAYAYPQYAKDNGSSGRYIRQENFSTIVGREQIPPPVRFSFDRETLEPADSSKPSLIDMLKKAAATDNVPLNSSESTKSTEIDEDVTVFSNPAAQNTEQKISSKTSSNSTIEKSTTIQSADSSTTEKNLQTISVSTKIDSSSLPIEIEDINHKTNARQSGSYRDSKSSDIEEKISTSVFSYITEEAVRSTQNQNDLSNLNAVENSTAKPFQNMPSQEVSSEGLSLSSTENPSTSKVSEITREIGELTSTEESSSYINLLPIDETEEEFEIDPENLDKRKSTVRPTTLWKGEENFEYIEQSSPVSTRILDGTSESISQVTKTNKDSTKEDQSSSDFEQLSTQDGRTTMNSDLGKPKSTGSYTETSSSETLIPASGTPVTTDATTGVADEAIILGSFESTSGTSTNSESTSSTKINQNVVTIMPVDTKNPKHGEVRKKPLYSYAALEIVTIVFACIGMILMAIGITAYCLSRKTKTMPVTAPRLSRLNFTDA